MVDDRATAIRSEGLEGLACTRVTSSPSRQKPLPATCPGATKSLSNWTCALRSTATLAVRDVDNLLKHVLDAMQGQLLGGQLKTRH